MKHSKHIKLVTKAGDIDLDNLDEYVVGFKFFYARHLDGETVSISRDVIIRALRQDLNGEYKLISLRKPKSKKKIVKGGKENGLERNVK